VFTFIFITAAATIIIISFGYLEFSVFPTESPHTYDIFFMSETLILYGMFSDVRLDEINVFLLSICASNGELTDGIFATALDHALAHIKMIDSHLLLCAALSVDPGPLFLHSLEFELACHAV
jgi:hypothetical protein